MDIYFPGSHKNTPSSPPKDSSWDENRKISQEHQRLRIASTNVLYLLRAAFMQESHILSLGVTSHRSWWQDNGPGCRSHSLPAAEWREQPNPELTTVASCWLEYHYIEVLHCIIQLLISVSLKHTTEWLLAPCWLAQKVYSFLFL